MKVRKTLSYNTAPKCYKDKNYSFVGTAYDMWKINGNCTHYAYARSCELAGKNIYDGDFTRFPNAGSWYKYTNWNIGITPKAGAIGECQNHLFIVEEVYDDGTYLISQSSYKDFLFNTKVVNIKVGETFSNISGKLLHFIYNPYVKDETKTDTITTEQALDKMADDVIDGKYGNGRTVRMTNIYNAVQNKVNIKMENK